MGGACLRGEVRVTGAKNSVLKLMAASLLASGKTTITNVPEIADVDIMSDLLTRLGCTLVHKESTVTIDVPAVLGHRADYDLVRKMRASINVLGPLVARIGQAEVALPGGDAIGSRGLDFHIKGLETLGARAHIEHGYVIAEAPNGLVGAAIALDFPSVGATENIMTAAVLAQGVTTIDNAAREPDLVDLGEFLISMGAKIHGLGTPLITITGVSQLHPTTHATIADRIITGTWAFAAAMTRGDITIHGARAQDLELPLEKLASAGAIITSTPDGIRVRMDTRPQAIDVSTLPYPSIDGVAELSGAPVEATDIRAGAGLILAGLVSEGETTIDQAFHVDRGYPNFAEQLCSLGATVSRE